MDLDDIELLATKILNDVMTKQEIVKYISDLTYKNTELRIGISSRETIVNELNEKLKVATAMLTKGTYPNEDENANDFEKQFVSRKTILDEINRLRNQLNSAEDEMLIFSEADMIKCVIGNLYKLIQNTEEKQDEE